MLTSGQILDLYDDRDGELFRTLYPSEAAVPEIIKQASTDCDKWPDDVYALVIVSDDDKFRKFACIDPGNTILSMEYFVKTAELLPTPVQHQVAENLKIACEWYDLDVHPELQDKYAGVLGWAAKGVANSMQAKPLQTAWKALQTKNQFTSAGQQIQDNLSKIGEASGTSVMPTAGGNDGTSPTKSLTTLRKTGESNPDTFTSSEDGEAPQRLPQLKVMNPYVSAKDVETPRAVIEKKAHFHALNGRFPLDTFQHLKLATDYFQQWRGDFLPEERREFCVNLVKRAHALGVEVPEDVERYGSEKLASAAELDANLALRKDYANHEDPEALDQIKLAYDELLNVRNKVQPDEFVYVLSELDKMANVAHLYDSHIYDPYYVTYGSTKVAEDKAFFDTIDNDSVSGEDLKNLAAAGRKKLLSTFGEDFVDEFKDDPIAIYKSMPLEQKKIIMHMARQDTSDDATV